MALTARWNGAADEGKRVVQGACDCGASFKAELGETAPIALERFALADFESVPGEAGTVRMVTVHSTRERTPEDEGLVFAAPGPERFDRVQDVPAAQIVGADEPAPRARALIFDDLFPQPKLTPEQSVTQPVQQQLTPEILAEKLLSGLEQSLAEQRRPKAPGETRPTPKERAGRIELCEAVLPAAHGDSPLLRFAAGCCRHPGMGFDRELADRSLDALAQLATGGDGPELVLMLGDQIYADATAGVIDAEDRLEK